MQYRTDVTVEWKDVRLLTKPFEHRLGSGSPARWSCAAGPSVGSACAYRLPSTTWQLRCKHETVMVCVGACFHNCSKQIAQGQCRFHMSNRWKLEINSCMQNLGTEVG